MSDNKEDVTTQVSKAVCLILTKNLQKLTKTL